LSAGTLLLTVRMTRGLRTSWLIVGMVGYLLPAVFREFALLALLFTRCARLLRLPR
jgi:hypothetical protein